VPSQLRATTDILYSRNEKKFLAEYRHLPSLFFWKGCGVCYTGALSFSFRPIYCPDLAGQFTTIPLYIYYRWSIYYFPGNQVLEKNLLQQYHKSALILGLITGILPCAPLLALLGYVALVSKTWPQAFIYCLSFGLGTFLSPLLMISILSGLIPRFLEGQKAIYYRVISVVCGLIMVFLGINLILRAGY
jgi:hypothetical protein